MGVNRAPSITFLGMVVPEVHWLCDGHLYVHGRYTVTAFQRINIFGIR